MDYPVRKFLEKHHWNNTIFLSYNDVIRSYITATEYLFGHKRNTGSFEGAQVPDSHKTYVDKILAEQPLTLEGTNNYKKESIRKEKIAKAARTLLSLSESEFIDIYFDDYSERFKRFLDNVREKHSQIDELNARIKYKPRPSQEELDEIKTLRQRIRGLRNEMRIPTEFKNILFRMKLFTMTTMEACALRYYIALNVFGIESIIDQIVNNKNYHSHELGLYFLEVGHRGGRGSKIEHINLEEGGTGVNVTPDVLLFLQQYILLQKSSARGMELYALTLHPAPEDENGDEKTNPTNDPGCNQIIQEKDETIAQLREQLQQQKAGKRKTRKRRQRKRK